MLLCCSRWWTSTWWQRFQVMALITWKRTYQHLSYRPVKEGQKHKEKERQKEMKKDEKCLKQEKKEGSSAQDGHDEAPRFVQDAHVATQPAVPFRFFWSVPCFRLPRFWFFLLGVCSVSGTSTTSDLDIIKPSLNGSLVEFHVNDGWASCVVGPLADGLLFQRWDLGNIALPPNDLNSSCAVVVCSSLAGQCSLAPGHRYLFVGWCVACFICFLTSGFLGKCLWFQQKPWFRKWKRYKKRHVGRVRVCALFHVLGFLFSSLRIRQNSSSRLAANGTTVRHSRQQSFASRQSFAGHVCRFVGKTRRPCARMKYRLRVQRIIRRRRKFWLLGKGVQCDGWIRNRLRFLPGLLKKPTSSVCSSKPRPFFTEGQLVAKLPDDVDKKNSSLTGCLLFWLQSILQMLQTMMKPTGKSFLLAPKSVEKEKVVTSHLGMLLLLKTMLKVILTSTNMILTNLWLRGWKI